MSISITGTRNELGRILARRRTASASETVHINVAGQQANSLLHDGHAWKGFPRTAVAATRRAMASAGKERATIFVHASFAFVRAVERGGMLEEPLRSSADAILECEALVLSGPVPAYVVRLGYLYGPESSDLRAYRTAFRLHRPYWSGPPSARQYHIHQFDAASALLTAARRRHRGKIFYATDDRPDSFMHFMDAFAHRVGRSKPLHLPPFSELVARAIIAKEHMQQTALAMPPRVPPPRLPGWKPKFPDYRKGLDAVIEAWDN